MKGDPPRRRSLRLKGYDYTQPGAYFITACTKGRVRLFGQIVAGEMRLNAFGRIVQEAWEDLPNHYPAVELDAFIVMPNHVHGIIILTDIDPSPPVRAGLKPAPTTLEIETNAAHTGSKPAPTSPASKPIPSPRKRHGLPEIVRAFKTFSARRINERRGKPGTAVWQRSYYEHIIRDKRSLDCIREYIARNPLQWTLDRENRAST